MNPNNNNNAADVQPASGIQAWGVVGLAAGAQAVSNIDQAVVGLAAEPIMEELSLTTAQYGFVAGSLYTLYSVGGIAVGLLAAPRFSPRSSLIVMLLLWSLSQLPIVLAASFTVLVACRVVLGAAGGAGTATSMNICHEWFPDNRRSVPSSLLMVGGPIGTMVAAPALTYIIIYYGWRSAFLTCAVLGLVVMFGFLLVRRNGPYAAEPVPDQKVHEAPGEFRRLVLDPTIIGNALVGLCAYWVIGFMMAWLAPYVRDQGGLSAMSSGWALSFIFLAQSIIVVAVAALSQRLLNAGYSSRVGRSYVMVACLLGSAACFIAMALVTNGAARLVLVTLATSLAGSIFALSSAMITEVVPGAERYRLMTITFALVTLSALVSPGLAGASIELGATHGWRFALLQIAAVGVIGGLIGLRTLHPAATIARFSSGSAAAVDAKDSS